MCVNFVAVDDFTEENGTGASHADEKAKRNHADQQKLLESTVILSESKNEERRESNGLQNIQHQLRR